MPFGGISVRMFKFSSDKLVDVAALKPSSRATDRVSEDASIASTSGIGNSGNSIGSITCVAADFDLAAAFSFAFKLTGAGAPGLVVVAAWTAGCGVFAGLTGEAWPGNDNFLFDIVATFRAFRFINFRSAVGCRRRA